MPSRSRLSAKDSDLLQRFLAALRQTPIPTAPSPHDGYQEALGLNLLDLALRLGHIDRMTEALTLADSTHMARSVSIDVNMNVLTAEQKWALRSDPSSSGGRPTAVWLPVSRQSRSSGAPVIVHDAAGNVVPRTTEVETAHALIHGMCKAFRMFLTSDRRTEDPDELLHGIRHNLNRSRWLIEATIANMIMSGWQDTGPVMAHADGSRATDSDSIREKAARAIEELFPPDSPFLRLLDVASSEYLLVVEVPTRKAQAFLRYDAPVIPARARDLRARDTIGRWAAFQQEFTVRYSTIIPRAVNSYHVTLEVPHEIQVRRFFLTSDVDAPALRSLVEDMRAVSESYDELRAVTPKLLELEMQGIASRLAEFGRRRYRDLEQFRAYIGDRYAAFSSRPPRFPARGEAGAPVTPETCLLPDRPIATRLAQFSHLYETDHYRKLADGLVTRDTLDELADELIESQLDKDVLVDNDPRENAGHAHWQRRPFGADPQSVEPVTSTVYIALGDDPPSLASDVSKLLLAVLLLVLGFGIVLEPSFFRNVPLLSDLGARFRPATAGDGPMSTADAVVTMLLLVPGLLLSRLDIPSNKTVLGQLRLFPRYVAYSSVIIAGMLALLVASGRADRLDGPFVFGMAALLVLFLLVGVDSVSKAVKRRSRVPVNTISPAWLIAELGRRPRRRRKRCSVDFSTVGSENLV
ncbi:hypothetical protein [Actinophytocola sp.]|uniref:hypothetical protein n=1 Tax=Actinophytocola sp. TaxID=1872138 RepID=UPI002ED9F461